MKSEESDSGHNTHLDTEDMELEYLSYKKIDDSFEG